MATTMDKCHLCKETAELRKSHIIPGSFFKFVRDDSMSNRFYELYQQKDQIIQDGPKEHLLCDTCEQQIGRYEKYFKEAMHFSRHGVLISQNDNVATIEKLEYRRTKLFFLSLLWRMSISSLPQFGAVSPGSYSERIKDMLLGEDPGSDLEYSVNAIIPLLNHKMQEEFITTPFVSKYPKATVYHLVVGGILYSLSTASQYSIFPRELLLNESGKWIIPLMDVSSIPFLWEHICHHFKDGKLEQGAASHAASQRP